jgi:hypothetical protein
MTAMRFARYVFALAGGYGLLMMIPYYFMEERIGIEYPPAISHPEFYYGFVGVTLAWQILFLIIARDPVQMRPAMLAAVVEKLSFAITIPILFAMQRVPGVVVAFSCVDLLFAILFATAYVKTGSN